MPLVAHSNLPTFERLKEAVRRKNPGGARLDGSTFEKAHDLRHVLLMPVRIRLGPTRPDAANHRRLLDQDKAWANRLLSSGETHETDASQWSNGRNQRSFEQFALYHVDHYIHPGRMA